METQAHKSSYLPLLITSIRMADGSRRVINDANPESWRAGERLMVIGGVKPSNR